MKSEYIGVKFYSKTDLSIGWALEKAENKIKDFDENKFDYGINCILEMYNICLLFNSEIKLESWSEKYYIELNLVVDRFKAIIGKYFSEIDYLWIKTFYPEISIHYKDSFWEVFDNYKIYEKVSNEEFISLLEILSIPLYLILQNKNTVKYYNNVITNYMKKSNSSAEILISQYLASKETNSITYYIPSLLKPNDKIDIIENYVDKEYANPNCLLLLANSRLTKEFPISDEIRLKAKKKFRTSIEKNFNSLTTFSIEATVGFSNSDNVIDVSLEDVFHPKITYSRLWFSENLDNPTLLNNFIYLFIYVDNHFRSTFPSNKRHLSILERLPGLKGKREYEIGMNFKVKENISLMQIKGYYNELLKLDKKLEDVFKWFFEDYLNKEFQAEGFILSIPSSESSFLEKIRTMCSEIDSILRQFMLYVNNGKIDRELIEISRNTPLIEEIPSFFNKKYGYIVDSELLDISHLLFSDQSQLAYIKSKKEYNTFSNLINNEDMLNSDFLTNQATILNLLKEKNIIYEDKDNYLRFRKEITTILRDFYQNNVICLSYYEDSELLEELINENKIECESTLFSKPEQRYLNYMLNDRQFDNGPAIRNKYLHGNSPQRLEEHKNDYFQILKIFALIIIKINEEFCLKDKKQIK